MFLLDGLELPIIICPKVFPYVCWHSHNCVFQVPATIVNFKVNVRVYEGRACYSQAPSFQYQHRYCASELVRLCQEWKGSVLTIRIFGQPICYYKTRGSTADHDVVILAAK